MTPKKSQVAFNPTKRNSWYATILLKNRPRFDGKPATKTTSSVRVDVVHLYWYTQLTIGKQYGGSSFLHNNTSDLNANLSKKVQKKCYVVFFCLLELYEVTLLTCVQPRPFPISKIFLLRGGSGCTQAIALWDCRRVFSRHSNQPNNFHVLVSFVTRDNMITLIREKNTRLDGLRGITPARMNRVLCFSRHHLQ